MQLSHEGIKGLRQAVMNRNVNKVRHCISENDAILNSTLEVCVHVIYMALEVCVYKVAGMQKNAIVGYNQSKA